MVTSYFKILLLLVPLSAMSQVEMGVVTVPVVNEAAPVKETTKEAAVTKEGSFIDSEGDKITILDQEAREKINAAKDIKATNVYDNEKEIENYKSEYQKNILEDRTKKYGEYVVKKGDTLKGISQKLYGTTKKWTEIQLLNENKIENSVVKVGTKLKYLINDKDVESERKDSREKN